MYLTYRPDGGEPQSWTVNLGKLRSLETEAIEKVTGLDYGTDFKQKLLKGNTLARRALLWTMLRRTHPTVRFGDVDFADDELQLQMDRQELTDVRQRLLDTDMPEAERSLALQMIDFELITAPEPAGKAPANASENGTGSASPS